MRIMMISQSYPPIIEGISQYVRSLSVELASRNHDVCVVTLWTEGLPEFEIDHGVEVYRIKGTLHRIKKALYSHPGKLYAPPFMDPELMVKLIRLVKNKRPQIVHAHNWLLRSFIPIKKWSGAKLVVTLQDYNLVCAKWSLIYKNKICEGPAINKCVGCAANHYGNLKGSVTLFFNWMMGYFEKSAVDIFIPVSHAVVKGNRLIENRLPFRLIPNFMLDDAEVFQEANVQYSSQLPEHGYILFVGAFAENKGVNILLSAYKEIKNAPPLVLIGYEINIKPFLQTDLPRNVIVLKNWPHPAVMEAWKHSSMAVIPSVWLDPCPAVAFEAMKMGNPVIASRVGGLTDIVDDGMNGILITPGDPIQLRQSIELLLMNKELRTRMSRAAKIKAKNYMASRVVPLIEALYNEIL
jgi:glycosyltransferase involved in cell wall biosynthesis